MLQSVEYEIKPFWQWYKRTSDFARVMKRRGLVKTKAASALVTFLLVGMLLQVLVGVWLTYQGSRQGNNTLSVFGLAVILSYPFVWVRLVIVALTAGRILIVAPITANKVRAAKQIFAAHKGIKIAVLGSYGKTSMKELLGTVLSEGKTVAMTPANKNVIASHASFAKNITGNEDILIIEYGESQPGDIAKMASITKPNRAIITGIAPAHLDKYATIDDVTRDILSITNFVAPDHIYANASITKIDTNKTIKKYSDQSVNGWQISHVKVDFDGLRFTMKKAKKTLNLHSGLLGQHQVGPLAAVASLADELGLTTQQIEKGIAKTTAFEHRMQARQLRGAWILDDTYNGNIEGMRAGLDLLKTLPAKRRIYVTPGLVDQGVETEDVHKTLGQYIAKAKPDMVVLMQNSVTDFITKGLEDSGYKGTLQIEKDPLNFYTNIEHILAAGDVIMLQNDWPDNYN